FGRLGGGRGAGAAPRDRRGKPRPLPRGRAAARWSRRMSGSPTPPSSRLLELGPGRPVIEVLEAGDGEPLLFLHGAGGVPAWEGALPALSRAFHVYAPLLPGFGRSARLEYLDDQCDLFFHGFDVMEARGICRPYVVGESLGGWMAAEMAALRPEEIGRLALAAPI